MSATRTDCPRCACPLVFENGELSGCESGCSRFLIEIGLNGHGTLPSDSRATLQHLSAWDRCKDLAREERLLDRLKVDLHRTGLVGEERSALTLYLIVTTRLLDTPCSAVLKGPS